MKEYIDKDKIEELALENIMLVMNEIEFSQSLASKIVGGKTKLMRLIREGKIDVSVRGNTSNAKWNCNAAQVLRYCHYKRRSTKIK